MNSKRRHHSPAFAAALALLCVPVTGYSQSILLSAEDFVILGGTAVTVGGAGPNTYSNGNVGSPASISGFPPATVVNGTTILGGPVVGQAMIDFGSARDKLNALVVDPANNLTGQDLGGMTLTPGVYGFNVAAEITLAGTKILTLDAQGKNNVTWVINVGTSLTTAAGAQVQFINLGSNGGADNGLFWNAGTSITFGASNTVAGNYLAGENITFGTTLPATGAGSGRALAGAIVSFEGQATLDVLGAPGNGDLTGGLALDGGGNLVSSGYVLLSPTGVYAQGGSGLILRPGTVYNTLDVTVDGNMTDGLDGDMQPLPSKFTVFNTVATLTGTGNTYTGGTVVDGGTLTAGSANLPTDGAVSLIDSNATGTVGALIFNQADDGTFGGVISGGGTVTKQNTGGLTLTGANTYTGGTVVSEGTLVASASALPANGAVTLGEIGTLIFNETETATFDGAITGAGTVRKQGAGTLTLAQVTAAPVFVDAGTLYMNGGLGVTTIATGARLGGSGTISGNLFNNGTLSPGLSPGTINIAGDYVQSADGTLVIEIASAASFDQVIVAGSASLGGTLQIETLGGYNPVGESFLVLTADGGVVGTFDVLTGAAAVGATVTYSANGVTIAFVQIPLVSFGLTPNQRAVAAAAQDVPALTAALNLVPLASQMPGALNALSPQGYQVWSDIAFARATALSDRYARDQGPMPDHGTFYFDAGQRRGRARADLDVSTSDYQSDTGLVGINTLVAPDLVLGALFNYEDTDAYLGGSGGNTSIKSYLLGARAGWKHEAWFVNTLVAYGYDDYESRRSIRFPGTSAEARSSTDGRQWLADISGGRRFTPGIFTLSPFVGVLAGGWKADGFTETGAGDLNATVGDQSARSLQSQVGLEAALDWHVGDAIVRPHARAAWLHEFSNDSRDINAAFGDTRFAVETRDPQRDSARLSVGLDVALSPSVMLYTDVSTQTGGVNRVRSEWRAGLSVGF